MRYFVMRAWLEFCTPFILLTLGLTFSQVEVQARGEDSGSPPALESNPGFNASRSISSQTSQQPLTLPQGVSKATASTTALSSISSTASITKKPVATEQGTTAATDPTATGSGEIGGFIPCGADKRRWWSIKGRRSANLHVRIECLAPGALQPATALVPDSNPVSKAEKKLQPTSSPEPQATKASEQASSKPTDTQQARPQQTGGQQTNSQQTESQRTASQQLDPQQTKSQQTDSEQKSSEQIGSQQTEPQQADNEQTDIQQTGSPKTDSQPAKDTSHVESEESTPNVASAPVNSAIIVQGQTVPANGEPITVNNQPVVLSSGYIHVGSSSAPIPEAQVTPPAAQPIIAGTLTFHPASLSPVAQAALSPFVVGSLTFSAAQPAPSTKSDMTPHQSQAQPIVVGGKMYAPIEPPTGSESSQGVGQQPKQEDSESSKSPDRPDNSVNGNSGPSDESNNQHAHADSKPIVIGDTTYTPVPTTATPSPHHPLVFSFSSTFLTQGGPGVTISDTLISLGPSGVLIGTSSLAISTALPTPSSILTINSQTLTALPGSGSGEGGFEVAASTLLPGSPGITLSGTLYSLNLAGSLIVGTSTIALPLATATLNSNINNNAAITAVGATFTSVGSTLVIVHGTTLSIGGPAITSVDTHGTHRLSLASSGMVVIGSSTFAYATPAAAESGWWSSGGALGSTGVVGGPSGGGGDAAVAATPSATGRVYRSGASGRKSVNRVVVMMVVASAGILVVSLWVMLGMM